MKTETLNIKVTADLSDFPVILTTAERDAYKEAVEVLEAMESNARIDALVAGQARDYYLKNWEAQRNECRRLADQVSYYKAASEDWHKCAMERAESLRRIGRERDEARNQLERMRGVQADATGAEIVALVRDGFGVRIEPGDFPRNIPAKVTVEKHDGDMRHANTRAFDTREAVNATTVVSNLAYTIKSAAYQLRAAIRPKYRYADGGVIGPSTYADWLRANPNF